jgi:hypothetical protein
MLLVSLAKHFLVRLRIQFEEQAPAVAIYQVRLLLSRQGVLVVIGP